MSWGCYKHEMDAGSRAWEDAVAEATPPPYHSWGRHEEVCPKCWMELKLERDLLQELLGGEGITARVCSTCNGEGLVDVAQWWPPGEIRKETCSECLGAKLVVRRGLHETST